MSKQAGRHFYNINSNGVQRRTETKVNISQKHKRAAHNKQYIIFQSRDIVLDRKKNQHNGKVKSVRVSFRVCECVPSTEYKV